VNILVVAEVSMAQVIGGAERVLRNQALGLAARGHAVRVLTRLAEGETDEQVLEGITETRYSVDRRGTVAFFTSTIRNARRAVAGMTRENRPDVLLVHQALPGLAVLGALPQIPCVYVCHSLAHEEFETRYRPPSGLTARLWHRCQSMARRQIERVVLKRASRAVVLSDFMRRRMVECHRVSDDRVRVVPGGVDIERFRPVSDRRPVRAALGLDETDFVLFTVRNLQPRMGLAALIRATARLKHEIPRLTLLIGGSGPLRENLTELVKTLGLEGCVRLLGFVPDDALPDYYRAADLFVLPTAQLEGFGLVTVEALASGTPVYGTPVGATGEILGKLDGALLAVGSDADALVAGIASLHRRLTADPAGRDRLSAECRALALRDYTWARHCAQIEAVLSEALPPVPAADR
jgi:glycosyltransferase involved in cell wall biosynthesis